MKTIVLAVCVILGVTSCEKKCDKPEINSDAVHKVINSKKIS